jgi:hypothetical protein
MAELSLGECLNHRHIGAEHILLALTTLPEPDPRHQGLAWLGHRSGRAAPIAVGDIAPGLLRGNRSTGQERDSPLGLSALTRC